MNDGEQLSTLLDRAVGQPPRDIDVDDVRRRARRQRVTRAVSVGAVLVPLLAVVVTAGALHLRATGSPPASTVSPSPTVSVSPTACRSSSLTAALASSQGAAGTSRWVVALTNRSSHACVTSGYPSISFRTGAGWLGVRASHGGYPDIEQPATKVRVGAGQHAYVVVYTSDVTTSAGGCSAFTGIRVTLPGGASGAAPAAGCVTPSLVHVGPVTGRRPAG